ARTLAGRAAGDPARRVGDVHVGQVAGGGGGDELLATFEGARQRGRRALFEQRGAVERDPELGPAHVLRAALQQRGAERHPAVLAQGREALAPALVLVGERACL